MAEERFGCGVTIRWFAMVFCSVVPVCFWGCRETFFGDVAEFVKPGGDPNEAKIVEGYEKVLPGKSSSAEVLSVLFMPRYELLSQSKSVIAVQGERKRGWEKWFKMVAFDENDLRAKRKYLCVVDERPKHVGREPWEGLALDGQMLADGDVLAKAYESENARRIAILKSVLKDFRKDIGEVKADNKSLDEAGMMINQAMETIRTKLDKSPAMASMLSEAGGVEFEHINLGKGKIRMVIEKDMVSIKMRLGSFVPEFEKEEIFHKRIADSNCP